MACRLGSVFAFPKDYQCHDQKFSRTKRLSTWHAAPNTSAYQSKHFGVESLKEVCLHIV
jgi:hypothetical protein